MKNSPDTSGAPTLEELLKRAQQLAEAGTYREALASAREAKRLLPNSVYVLALEKQIEQIIELTDAKIITDDQRADILESIPGIIERVLQASPSAPKPAPAQTLGGRDRAAALEWLKNQYFQHAHDFVKRGEYENALAEIRRVFIIDPENSTAKDFEQQIEELAQVRRSHISAASIPSTAGPTGAAAPGPRPVSQHRHVVSQAAAAAEQKLKRRPALTIILFIVLAVVAIITVYVVMKLQPSEPKPATPTVISPSQEIFQEAGQDSSRFVVPRADTAAGGSRRGTQAR